MPYSLPWLSLNSMCSVWSTTYFHKYAIYRVWSAKYIYIFSAYWVCHNKKILCISLWAGLQPVPNFHIFALDSHSLKLSAQSIKAPVIVLGPSFLDRNRSSVLPTVLLPRSKLRIREWDQSRNLLPLSSIEALVVVLASSVCSSSHSRISPLVFFWQILYTIEIVI